jgi:hypothetical protein
MALSPDSICWHMMPCTKLKVDPRFGGKYRLHLRELSRWFLDVKMETRSSEKSVDFERTTWRYTSEGITLHNNRCENVGSTAAFSLLIFLLCGVLPCCVLYPSSVQLSNYQISESNS